MVDIRTKMEVECTDGFCGKSTHLIIDPKSGKLTHFVVKGKELAALYYQPDRLVPVEKILDTSSEVIHLSCTIQEVSRMPAFTTIHYIQTEAPDLTNAYMGAYQGRAHLPPNEAYSVTTEVKDTHIPSSELAISQDMEVQTGEDGKVGQVDGLVVDPESGEITHLLMRKGHLWGTKDVIVPVSAIERSDEDHVYLKIDKQDIKKLPSIPLKPHFG